MILNQIQNPPINDSEENDSEENDSEKTFISEAITKCNLFFIFLKKNPVYIGLFVLVILYCILLIIVVVTKDSKYENKSNNYSTTMPTNIVNNDTVTSND